MEGDEPNLVKDIGTKGNEGSDILDAAEIGKETLGKVIIAVGNGLKFMGISTTAQKLVEEMVKKKLVQNATLTWFAKLPYVKSFRALMVVGGLLATGHATPEKLAKSLETAHSMYRIELKQRATEHLEDEAAQAPEEKLQEFLSAIQSPVKKLQAQFANTGDTVKDQAWRIALANIFTPYENRITREKLQDVPGYRQKIGEILGVPVSLDDIFEGKNTAEYLQNYPKFKEQFFKIYASPEFANLQHIAEDSRMFFYYDVLDSANDNKSDRAEFTWMNQGLVQEAIAYFKKGNNLEAIMELMESGAVRVAEDSTGKRISLDIPEKLRI